MPIENRKQPDILSNYPILGHVIFITSPLLSSISGLCDPFLSYRYANSLTLPASFTWIWVTRIDYI